ncbi:MAG: carboxyl transferase domain-containing protein [Myxococcota bacterium]|nr:carboxyl transferase domain-containing protein [Myxococcota bacterium]
MSDSGTRTLRRVGILNRGEPAMRCLRTLKALRRREGLPLEGIAFHTDVDRDAPFVRHADAAFRLDAPDGDTAAWLDHDGLIDALLRARCDAVWPGWGFVSEDARFVERVRAAGIVFLGPSPEAMRGLGDKVGSKEIAEAAGVPVIPWSGGVVSDFEAAREAAAGLGHPLVVKAAAGGGGRGIRMVETSEGLEEAFRSAASEARTAFGDDRLFLERRIDGGRHVEVQIVADAHGNVHALGCRDCSVQRRHQKVVEEAPPPGLSAGLRARLEESAVQLARAVDYQGAGTVEFLVAGDDYYLLEMNPRLQVEHGVTEALTGLDLVELQIRIGRGESLADLEIRESGAAMEVRLCAEDPAAGFLPAPGRVARFDPAFGPRLRIDTGVVAGSVVPAAFDSLIAKIIAVGDTREAARARLAAALSDTEVVVEGGTTNRGYLAAILDHADFRAGGVDVAWLDRTPVVAADPERQALALVTAAILRYQQRRAAQRINFYADPSLASGDRIPVSSGLDVDLEQGGQQVRLQVLALGAWRYRVRLDDRVVHVRLREEDAHAARLEAMGASHRVLHDVSEAGVRVEIEGVPYRFGFQSAGQVRAAAPALVVAIHVQPGDSVRAGQRLGLLEAMKVEVGFDAPITGVVSEIRVSRGQQVAAGEVVLVIDAAESQTDAEAPKAQALELHQEADPIAALFRPADENPLGTPDLASACGLGEDARRAAVSAMRDEIRRVLMGYDADPERTESLARLLDAPLPESLPERFGSQLSGLREELVLFADVASLFVRSPETSVSGSTGPSNYARLQQVARRIHAAGSGVDEAFLDRVRCALAHYGVDSLEPSDALERAFLRLLASQRVPQRRDRLVASLLRHVTALARSGQHLEDARALEAALGRIATLRGTVGHEVADAAIEARYVIFDGPQASHRAEHASKALASWLEAAEAEPTAPPDLVLRELADAPAPVFERVGRWLADPDPRRRSIALSVHVRRLYAPAIPSREAAVQVEGGWIERLDLPGGRTILAGTCEAGNEKNALAGLVQAAERERENHEWPAAFAIELFVRGDPEAATSLSDCAVALGHGLPCARFTRTLVAPAGEPPHQTLVPSPEGYRLEETLRGVHPAASERVGLGRLAEFDLELLSARDDVYGFAARSRALPSDERIVVLAEVRSRTPDLGTEARLHVPAFEHVFNEATRTLRLQLGLRDPKRRLQWNRIAIHVIPDIELPRETVSQLISRLAPATRNLGLEKVLVRLHLLDPEAPERPARDLEVVISDVSGQNLTVDWRDARDAPLEPADESERRVAEARRRRLVYPYEIIRMLTGAAGQNAVGTAPETGAGIPAGSFEEYDLDEDAPSNRPRSVAERSYGGNEAGVVFGLIRTPTEGIPEGMERVLLLSDPTRGMGSLADAECDRIVAALDLAEERGVPVDWVPISSGARIALDSGTENLDATARVVRRIVEFTGRGGVIHVIVSGVNVGAQSYFDALATMGQTTKGILIMTEGGSMVLTGRAALEASGSVSAEDEIAIGGHERVMGPNGEAQVRARDLREALRILHAHHEITYVVPGESGPRRQESVDPIDRDPCLAPVEDAACGFRTVGEIFDDETNPARKRPFPMRSVMAAVVDEDAPRLERWEDWVGAETAIVWETRLGGHAVSLIGIESQAIARQGHRPVDGPAEWNGGTLFPGSSKKVARALRSASGSRPAVVLANLSGFDGSPESMRKLQLEYGAEIARAVTEFRGPILFLVVSRYHGGAYVVFSRSLNPRLRVAALTGSYASVIGGSAAATAVFGREVKARAEADPRVRELRARAARSRRSEDQAELAQKLAGVTLEKQAELAAEFDAIHSVERARDVGSIETLVPPAEMRRWLIERLDEGP